MSQGDPERTLGPSDGLDLGAALAGSLGDLVVLVLDRGASQVLEIVTEGLIKQFVRHPPVGRHRPVFIGDVEHRKSSSLAFGFFTSHRSVSVYGWVAHPVPSLFR